MELKIHDQEIALQRLWKSRRLFKHPLQALTGETIEIIFAGRENLDSGPDFKDAVLKMDGRILKGDIEVHLDASGWYGHGHHMDPAYNNVILHLVTQSGEKTEIEREDSVRVRQVLVDEKEIHPFLSGKPGFEARNTKQGIVMNCPLSRTPSDKIAATVTAAGLERFYDHVGQFREQLSQASWNQIFYRKFCEALGYSKNQIPFRRLADFVTYALLTGEMHWVSEEMARQKCAALLYGAAGLLPSQAGISATELSPEVLEYTAPLEVLWKQLHHRLEIRPMAGHDWHFFRLRPQNFPTRRLAALAELLYRAHKEGFLKFFLKPFTRANRPDAIVRKLERLLLLKPDRFWSTHYAFATSKGQTRPAKIGYLLGKDRVREIIVNMILPVLYLYSQESGDGVLLNMVRETYRTYPKSAGNKIIRTMLEQLKLPDGTTKTLFRSSVEQQGLIQLHKIYCQSLRCDACLNLAANS